MNTSFVESYVYRLLEKLPPFLVYHNKRHTEQVTASALYICKQEHLTTYDTTLVKTAALLHDTGFLHCPDGAGHEAESCANARELLPAAAYNEADIDTICRFIMATKMPQSPSTHPEQILCDADLYYLGTQQYHAVSQLLFEELLAQGKLQNEKEWHRMQVEFLSTHHYFTHTAQQQLEMTKQINLQAILKTQRTEL